MAIAVAGSRVDRVSSECNLFWDNEGGDSFNYPIGSSDWNADPEFCGWHRRDTDVRATSPCLAENNACGAVIGAVGIGCVAVPISVESLSWGKIKGKYGK